MNTLAASGLPEHKMLIAKQLASKVPQRQEAALTTLRKTLKGAELAQHAGEMLKMIPDLKGSLEGVLVKAFEKLGPHLTDHIDALVALIDHADTNTRLAALKILAKCEGKALRDHKEPIAKCLDDSNDSIVAAAFSAMAAFEPAELEPFRNRIFEARHVS